MKLPFRRPRNVSRGQALVETALVLPILIMFLLLAIDVGRVFYTSINLRNAAHEATMYGGTQPDANLTSCPVDLKAIVDREMGRTDAECGPLGTEIGVAYITMASCERANAGPPCSPTWSPPYAPDSDLRFAVRIQYRFQPVMPLVGLLTGNGIGGSLPLTVENRTPVLVGYGN